jgi:hypothetical protein
MKAKQIVLTLSLAVLLVCGVFCAYKMGTSAPTYNGEGTDVEALYEHPEQHDNSHADGAAAVIVNENLDKTAADNVVFSVVFNFRGYDTLGESFILIAAIAGSLVILRKREKRPEPETEEQEAQA